MTKGTENICIFVSSSDHTRDVFDRVFAGFHDLWPNCPLPLFVGLTTDPGEEIVNGFHVVTAEAESGWQQELREQLARLPAQFDHVVLFLDDFLLLAPVDTDRMIGAARAAAARNLGYLRLIPPSRSWFAAFRHRPGGPDTIERLPRDQPYYASLQATIWRKSHLEWCLSQAGSIWQFEHILPLADDHWAVTRPALPYRHVVEKSRWMADARRLFARAGQSFDPGTRLSLPAHTALLWRLNQIKFGLMGYGGMRLKAWLRMRRGAQVKSPP
jgi:hypothetical protein